MNTRSSPRRAGSLRNGTRTSAPQHLVLATTTKQSPRMIRSLPVSSPQQQQQRSCQQQQYENHACHFATEAVSSAAELCDQYRQVLKEHVSMQRTTRAATNDDCDDDDDASQGDDDGDTDISLCDLDSLASGLLSFLSEVDSIKVRRHQIRHGPALSPSVKQNLVEMMETEDCPEDDLLLGDDDDDDMDSVASSADSVETIYSFDLDYMRQRELR